MLHCCICDKKSSNPNKSVRFYKFPEIPAIRSAWLEFAGCLSPSILKKTICSDHFEADCFENGKLRRNAIPTRTRNLQPQHERTAAPKPKLELIKLECCGIQDDEGDDFLPFSSVKKDRMLSCHGKSKSSNNSDPPPPKKATGPTQVSINARIDVDNEFELFGKGIAVQLKQMPLDRATLCREKIQQLMTRARLTQMQEKEEIANDLNEHDPLA